MSFDWSTYRPRRKTRNGFETIQMYFNWSLLIVAAACVALSILLVGCAREMEPLWRIQW